MKKNILHITSWFPNDDNPLEGIFIKEHIEALNSQGFINTIYAINLKKGAFKIKIAKKEGVSFIKIATPFFYWKIIEFVASFLTFLIILNNRNRSDAINFHIAYPNLVYWKYIKWIFNKPVFCVEHWSAYGLNFGLEKTERSRKKLSRVRAIFKNKIVFIFVSNHLKRQIEDFADVKFTNFYILPNVVNNLFKYDENENKRRLSFFSASIWRKGKRPLEMIEGFVRFSKSYPQSTFYIAGDGDLISEMEQLINTLSASNVTFLGRLSKNQLAEALINCEAVCHSSEFETFSVICAEALCAGKPLIVNKLPAVMEFTDENNCIEVNEISPKAWESAFKSFQEKSYLFNKVLISKKATSMFSPAAVGEKYKMILENDL